MNTIISKRILQILSISLSMFLILSGAGIAFADFYTYVYTPKGTSVLAIYMTDELTPAQIASGNNWVAVYYPNAVRLTNTSRKYNCHSYAWYNQSTNNSIWIDSPGDDIYWQDGSYLWITTAYGFVYPIPSNVPDGAKVSYGCDDHSAIKVSSTHFLSKWGQLPLMQHTPSHCPYYSYILSYYKHH